MPQAVVASDVEKDAVVLFPGLVQSPRNRASSWTPLLTYLKPLLPPISIPKMVPDNFCMPQILILTLLVFWGLRVLGVLGGYMLNTFAYGFKFKLYGTTRLRV